MSSISGSGSIIPYQPSGVSRGDNPQIIDSDGVIDLLQNAALTAAINAEGSPIQTPLVLQSQLIGGLTALEGLCPKGQVPTSIQTLINNLSSQTTYSGLVDTINNFPFPPADNFNLYTAVSPKTTDQLISHIFASHVSSSSNNIASCMLAQCLLASPPYPTPLTPSLQAIFGIPANLDLENFSLNPVQPTDAFCANVFVGRLVQGGYASIGQFFQAAGAGVFLNAILMSPMALLNTPTPSQGQIEHVQDLFNSAKELLSSLGYPPAGTEVATVMLQLNNDIEAATSGTTISTATLKTDWANLQNSFG